MTLLEHGGRLRVAAQRYGIPLEDWLDLSTGINPRGYPAPTIPAHAWQRLPEDDDGLEMAACDYYRCDHALPLPGSQAAIQLLPRLRPVGRVGVLGPCYQEHPHAWQSAGHSVTTLTAESLAEQIDRLDVVVVVNPNNPTARQWPAAELLEWHARLARRGGWLIVDEAFAYATPQQSIASASNRPGLIVLRSLGKFFGLAGARVGFALAEPALLQHLHAQLGPWAVSGPSRSIARAALVDRDWQTATRVELTAASVRLQSLLARHHLPITGATELFSYIEHPQAAAIAEALARRGILVRYFEHSALRLGLPGHEIEWGRLDTALKKVSSLIIRDICKIQG